MGPFTRGTHPHLASETGPHTVPLWSLLVLLHLSCPPSSETHLSSCLPIRLPVCPRRHTWILSSSRRPSLMPQL